MRCPKTPIATCLSGSAKETQLRLCSIFEWKKHRPPVWLFTLIVLVIMGCSVLVSCRQSAEQLPTESMIPELDESEQKTESAEESKEPPRIERAELTGLTLDANGAADDTAYLEADRSRSSATLRVVLGSGEKLEYQWDTTSYPKLSAARLTAQNCDSMIVTLSDVGSTYGAETVCIMDVADGQLIERLRFDGINGSYTWKQEDAPLDTLRLANLVNKWLQPEFYTAVWNGETFDLVPDGYLLDDHPLERYGADGTQGKLTLRLRISTNGDSFLRVDEIQLLRGEEIIQTFTSDEYGPLYANSYAAQTPLRIDDLNFDGYPDFGILCDQSREAKHHWFIWDEEGRRFKFFGTLGSELTVDETVWQITERLPDGVVNHYSVSYTGKLIPLLQPTEERPRFTEQSEAFQSVLRMTAPVLDATDADRERNITYIFNDLTFTPEWFSVVDLDRDGAPEVVLWMTLQDNPYIGFDILRWEDGKVISYSETYRGLQRLKEDGTYSYSGGAFNHGFGLCAGFGEDGVHTTPITWCESAEQASGVEYFVDGQHASDEQFHAALARQDENPSVVWYTLTEENIAILGSLIAAAAK